MENKKETLSLHFYVFASPLDFSEQGADCKEESTVQDDQICTPETSHPVSPLLFLHFQFPSLLFLHIPMPRQKPPAKEDTYSDKGK